jgi:DNA polymerase-3 subunit epsilon
VLNSYTAIDFETAQGKRWSICQVGLVRVENQIIKEQLSILVQPPDNYYWNNFIDIHGISPEQTADAPTFDKIWHQIEPFIKNQNVVAHNGFAFDFHCLKQTLDYMKFQHLNLLDIAPIVFLEIILHLFVTNIKST